MTGNVFEVVKQSISTRDAAEMYGIEVKRGGMACCPFHDDKHPSMKVDERFHCFGCQADGDVIDFTARLYNISPKEAAIKLAQDFNLQYDSHARPKKNYVRQKSEAQLYKEREEYCFHVLLDYYHMLEKWQADYAPKAPGEELHPRFAVALQKKDNVERLVDMFLVHDTFSVEERKEWVAAHSTDIVRLERQLAKIAEKDRLREAQAARPSVREQLAQATKEVVKQNAPGLARKEAICR